jgi:hypothetical protein
MADAVCTSTSPSMAASPPRASGGHGARQRCASQPAGVSRAVRLKCTGVYLCARGFCIHGLVFLSLLFAPRQAFAPSSGTLLYAQRPTRQYTDLQVWIAGARPLTERLWMTCPDRCREQCLSGDRSGAPGVRMQRFRRHLPGRSNAGRQKKSCGPRDGQFHSKRIVVRSIFVSPGPDLYRCADRKRLRERARRLRQATRIKT